MKTIPTALETHLQGDVTTLATCWKVTRTDGVLFRFTSHDRDLVVSGETYLAASGYTSTQISSSDQLNVDNLDVMGVLDSAGITEADLAAGLFDFAEVELFVVNWADTSMGSLPLRKGWLGESVRHDAHFVAELRGLTQALQQPVGDAYSVACRADLGDTQCGVTLATYTVAGSVTGVASRRQFTDSSLGQADDYFNNGLVTFTSGANNGLSREVKDFAGGVVALYQPFPNDIAVSDTYEIYPGCDKALATCRDTFSNVENFRGEPYIPGNDRLVSGS